MSASYHLKVSRVRAISTLAGVASLLFANIAVAQTTMELPGGWTRYLSDGTVANAVTITCSAKRAYVRTRTGAVGVWDGTSWSPLPPPPNFNRGREIWASPDDHVFVTTADRLSRWDGATWANHEIPPGPSRIRGVWGTSSRHVYLIGRGRIAYLTKAGFRNFDVGTWRDLGALWGSAADDIWIGGQGGFISRHDGQSWVRQKTGTTNWIDGIWGSGRDDVWAWGRDSDVIHWNGSGWTSRTEGLTFAVDEINGAAPNHVYAVGRFGLARWAETRWNVEVPWDYRNGEGPRPRGVCTTDRHVVVADLNGLALVRPR